MFFDKVSENEFFSQLDREMQKTASFDQSYHSEKKKEMIGHLAYAAVCLEQAGLTKEAQMVLHLKETCEDPALEGLDSEKMLENLKTKGWVFNADDGELTAGLKDLLKSLSDEQQNLVVKHLEGKDVPVEDEVEELENDALSKGLVEMLDSMGDEQQNQVKEFLSDSHDVCMADDCSLCTEGPEPQLSQTELKKLRDLLNKG